MKREDAPRQTSIITRELRDIQATLGETDEQFAARLGVQRSTWTLVKLGYRGPGRLLLGGARRAFPTLEEKILDFLSA